MIAIGFDPTSGHIVIAGNGVYGARTLNAALTSDQRIRITSLAGRAELYVDWDEVTDFTDTRFQTGPAALAYLQTEFAKGVVTGSPQRNYAVPVADGQTVFPISPAPVDVNTINLVVNGALYAPPDIAVSSTAITWQGLFDLAASDAVRAVYF